METTIAICILVFLYVLLYTFEFGNFFCIILKPSQFVASQYFYEIIMLNTKIYKSIS